MKLNLPIVFVVFVLLMLGSATQLSAQKVSSLDSIKKAMREQRAIDSLNRALKKIADKKQRDSMVVARREKRVQDSLLNLEKRKQFKDSLELVKFKAKFGEEKYQEKLEERERIKRMEEKYRKQRIEDSLFALKQGKEKALADSLAEVKRMNQRKLYVQDSLREVELRVTEAKRKQDSIAAALAFELEKQKQRDLALKAQEKPVVDSVVIQAQTNPPTVAQKEIPVAKTDPVPPKEPITTIAETPPIANKTAPVDSASQAMPPVVAASIPSAPTIPPKPETPETPGYFILWDEEPTTSSTNKPLPSLNIDSLRKVDSLKHYFSSFTYRLRKSTEISFYLGVSNYLGDIGGNSGLGKRFFYDNNFKKRNNFYGASFTYTRFEYLAFRLAYMNGKISASDHDIAFTSEKDNAFLRYKRNLDFQTKISEWSLLLECSPLKFFSTDKRAFKFPIQPYALLGLGTFRFNPQGSYYDDIAEDYIFIDLQPLRTEGQGMKEYPDRKPYALRQWNIPYGVGVKYVFGRRTSLGLEFVGRKLFTDYLDDVSTTYIDPALFNAYLDEENAAIARQIYNKSDEVDPDNSYGYKDIRGNPKHNDFYYSFNLKFSYRLSKLK